MDATVLPSTPEGVVDERVLDERLLDERSEVAWDFLVEELRPPALAPLLEILDTQDRYPTRQHVTYKEKRVLMWRVWPVLHVLRFCGEQEVLKMAVVSKHFKTAAYSILEEIARIKMTRFEKGGYTNFINEFAAFGQLEQHIAKFGRLSFMVDETLIDRDDMLLLYNTFQVTSKQESGPHCGLTPLAEFEWKARGFVHFQKYLQTCILLPMSKRSRFSYYFKAWKAVLDVLTLNFQLLKIRAWPVSILRDFMKRSVRIRTKYLRPSVEFSAHILFLLSSAWTGRGKSVFKRCPARTSCASPSTFSCTTRRTRRRA
jgi:hypothetical protein